MNNQDIRWQQRFDNFSKAYTLLRSALEEKEIDDFDDLQKEGLIQRFEYTFELLWKTMKDYLQNEKVDIEIISPKNVIKAAASSNLLEKMDVDGEILLDMHEKRNLMSHTYDITKFNATLIKLKNEYLPEIIKVYEYFSVKRLGI
ncbi:MAG: nucleotidyltransferase substrate binding protein [Lachnospiraceae bacterium]|nr:nucleotidyltransferase substrate binding protein [Lachnospiraceae bacterium]